MPDAFHGLRPSQHARLAPPRRGRRGEDDGQGLRSSGSMVRRRFERASAAVRARVRVCELAAQRERGRREREARGEEESEMGTALAALIPSTASRQAGGGKASSAASFWREEEERKKRKEFSRKPPGLVCKY